jgi:hypothetical protein
VSPAPPQILRVGVWAILGGTTTIVSTDQVDYHFDDANLRPTHSPSLIFHPPRLSPFFPTS